MTPTPEWLLRIHYQLYGEFYNKHSKLAELASLSQNKLLIDHRHTVGRSFFEGRKFHGFLGPQKSLKINRNSKASVCIVKSATNVVS